MSLRLRRGAAAILALAAGLACDRNGSATESAGISIDPTPIVSIGAADGEAAYRLLRVFDAMVVADGRIVISDAGSGELRVFDSTGSHLATIGRRGAGPMEFAEFSQAQLYANATQVIVGDEGAARVHVLTPDLTFRETRRFTLYPDTPRPFFRGLAANGDWIVQAFANGGTLSGRPGQVLESVYQLMRYDSLGAMRDTILALPGRARIVHEHRGAVYFPYGPLSSEPLFAIDGDRVVVVSGSAPALQIYGLDGAVIGEEVWDRERVRSVQLWDEYKRQSVVAMAGQRDAALYADFHEKAQTLPEYAPLYTGIKVDGRGRIWLERFRMPLDSARSWDVLDRDGRLLGTAETPRGVTVLRFTQDLMIGRARDSLGVERVQLFRVR